jgi:enoyl-CoA hydratase/carnithine racemase
MNRIEPFTTIPSGTTDLAAGLRLIKHQQTLQIILNRAEDHNRITDEMLDTLLQLCQTLQDDDTTSVIMITAEGSEFFSTGLLNPALRAQLSKQQVLDLVWKANRTFDAIEALPQMVIAALNGKAVAGGVELALACDVRYVSSQSSVRMPEASWGGFPGAGAPVRLPQLVGKAYAMELICSGREMHADDMLRIGLAQRILNHGHFQNEACNILESIGQAGPLAIKGAKKVIGTRLEPGFHAARMLSDALRQALEWSEDVDEAIAAGREQRKPVFKGR